MLDRECFHLEDEELWSLMKSLCFYFEFGLQVGD